MRRRLIFALAFLPFCMSHVQGATFDLQGHRGARGLAPENTLAAFATALQIGVATLELDLAMTRDRRLVVSHNQRLNPYIVRTASGEWLSGPGPSIYSLTLSELERYDVGRIKPGTRYAERFPHQVPRDGSRIPTLEAVVALVQRAGNRTVRFNLETKIDPRRPKYSPPPAVFADEVIEAIRKHGLEERSSVQSFDWRTLLRVQQAAPEVPTVYLTREKKYASTVQKGRPGASPWTAGFDVDKVAGSVPALVQQAGGRIWSPCFRDIHERDVAEAHDRGLRVIVWTVNGTDEMARMLKMNVDGIITDYPDRLRRVMQNAGRPLPLPTPFKF